MHKPEPGSAQPPFTDDYFRGLERERTQALVRQDMEVLNRLHAPEYQLITPAGQVFNRDDYLGAVRAGPFYTKWDLADIEVRKSSSTAILRYKAQLEFSSGKSLTCWHTDFYELRQREWQAVWSQATAITDVSSASTAPRPVA